MTTVIGQATDPLQPGVLGTPIPVNLAPNTPGTQSIGVKGDGGAGFPMTGFVTGRRAIGVLGTSTDPNGYGVLGENTAGGLAGQFDGNVQVNGNLNANTTSGRAINANSSDPNNDCINGTSSAAAHAGVSANNSGSGMGLFASSVHGSAVFAKGGGLAGQFEGGVLITGTLTVNADIILTGADCAEEFDIATDHAIEPGTVMVLDEAGSLRASDQAYDKKVAGVVSGAGDYRPGLILDRGNSSQKRLPLALVGKVYCKVDSQYSPIGVGDLLTTSPTLGHAMRAVDPLKAFGAVIGKALRPLRSGQGLIPILIALQ